MKLSVCMITYNHERFVSQAIESVLMQETNFDFELVIGEDCSPDGTRAIVQDYQRRYPDRIRLLLPETNRGAAVNFVSTLEACRGNYVALLEGDDYWTSPHKLQKQADFLDTHPGCSICYHSVEWVYEGGEGEPVVFPPLDRKEISTIEDLFVGNFVPTCSVVYRNGLFGAFPDWYLALKAGDWPLHFLNAMHGDLGFVGEVMGAYRVHAGGTWSASWTDESRCLTDIRMFECLKRVLAPRHAAMARAQIAQRFNHLSRKCEEAGDLAKARRFALRRLAAAPFDRGYWETPAKHVFRLYFSPIYRLLRTFKGGVRKLKQPD